MNRLERYFKSIRIAEKGLVQKGHFRRIGGKLYDPRGSDSAYSKVLEMRAREIREDNPKKYGESHPLLDPDDFR